jgi:2-methylcitrate dehydratase PrpD
MTIIEQMVKNLVETRFENFDETLVESAKLRIIDIVGCMIGGAAGPGNRELVDLVNAWGGKNESTILNYDVKAPACNAAMVNSIMARSFDYGVMSPLVAGKRVVAHISETTVPTAITAAEWGHNSGKELITSLILGDDIASRIVAASIPPLNVWDSTGTITKFGATAIAGKLQRLDERQLLNALGIVVNQLGGSMQCIRDGVHSFKLPQGLSARDGIIAVQLAQKGWTGMKDPLFSDFGYFALYCQSSDQDILTHKLGQEFYADAIFKPYPCCRAMQTAIDCALELVRKYDIVPGDIAEVIIGVTNTPGLKPTFEIGDLPQCTANFSPQYAVASVLLRGKICLDYYTEEYILDPAIQEFIANKVKIEAAPPDRLPSDQVLAGEYKDVRVKMKDGREFYVSVASAKGDALEKPLTADEIKNKFRDNVAFSKKYTAAQTESVLETLERIEDIDDISQFIKLLP